MTDKSEKVIVVHNPAPQSWVREHFEAEGTKTGRWKPQPGPQEEFFNGPDVKYSSLAPSPNPGWKYCPGSLTKKGNPK